MARFEVRATMGRVQNVLCSRPYPRSDDHLDPFTYPTRDEAQAMADKLTAMFPENIYRVQPC